MEYYISFFLLFGILSLTYAQDSSRSCVEAKHGLQFQIGSMLYLRNFDNYTFSYRYRFNIHSGFRIGLLTNYNKTDYDITQQADSITSKPPNYNHSYDFKISAQYLHSLITYKSFSLILGGGPFIFFSNSDYTSDNLAPTYISKYRAKEKTTGFGVDLILGAEYQLIDNIIISSEYNLSVISEKSDIEHSFSYIYPDSTRNSIDKENGTSKTFMIGGNAVNFGLTVFF